MKALIKERERAAKKAAAAAAAPKVEAKAKKANDQELTPSVRSVLF